MALIVSGVCELLKWPGPFPLSSYVLSEHNILPALFLACLLGVESRMRVLWLGIWFLAACITTLAAFADLPWGDVVTDANPADERKFFAYSLLSDGSFAFGSVILLGASIALLWREWRSRTLDS